jgi:hypothetical protein
MKRSILLAVLLCCACCAEQPTATPVAPPAVESARSTVFPAERGEQVRWLGYTAATDYWTPSAAEVAALERDLRPLLERAAAEPESVDEFARGRLEYQQWIGRELDQILERLDDYRLQYVGVVAEGGTRRILVRGFAGPAFEDGFEFENWREELAIVSDGGFWYWYAVYDPDTQRLVHFRSNGYA